jgi:hypothetical protein
LANSVTSSFLRYVRNNTLAFLSQCGAVLTILAQLSSELALPDWLMGPLAGWRNLTLRMWQPLFDVAGLTPHPNLVAALSVAFFLSLIGVGARVSRSYTRRPLAPLEMRFLDDMGWLSVAVLGSIIYVFLIGSGPDPSKVAPLEVYGSELAGRYLFAVIVMIGYALGDFFGHRAFHYRLLRMAAIFGLLIAGAWML